MSRKSPFPTRDVEKLGRDLEKNQGCKVVTKTKGIWVGFPNGESTTIHFTVSDVRAVKNIRACIERNGCTWPF